MPEQTEQMVPCPVARLASSNPDQPAVLSDDRSFSYRGLHEIVEVVRSGLAHQGIGAGTCVASSLSSDWKTAVLFWALLRLRACHVPLNRRLPPEQQCEQAALSGSRVTVTDNRMVEFNEECLAWPELEGKRPSIDGVSTLDLAAISTVAFTSGSTRPGKAVVHTLGAHWFSALGSQDVIPVGPDTRWLIVLPLYHVGGMGILFRCLLHGGCLLFAGGGTPISAVEAMRPTHVSLVATQLQRMLRENGAARLATLGCVLVGGSHVPDRLVREAVASGIAIRKTYGLTEMASQVATTSAGAGADELTTSGRVLPYREARVSDLGEIEVRGPTLFQGYLTDDGLSRPFDQDGWFSTGDLGRFDEEGRLTVTGRKDAMFVSGGENVHPEEIEAAILTTGLVERAVVVSVEDDEFGARPVAFVSPVPNLDELRSRLRDLIAGYKIPERFHRLPESSLLKPDRNSLADLARQHMRT